MTKTQLTPKQRAVLECSEYQWTWRFIHGNTVASLTRRGWLEAHILSANTALCRITPAGKQALKDNT